MRLSASAISAINKRLDESLEAFATRPLGEPFPYLILGARYEKVREGGVVMSQAVLIAIAVDWDGRRQILAVEMANRESRSSWKDFLPGLRRRGLNGIEFVVADDHAGLRSSVYEVLPEAVFQRCYVHFLRPRPSAAQGRRRLPAGIALALRPPFGRGGPPGPRRLDSPNGVPAIPNSSAGSKRPSRRPSLSIACRPSTISISRAQTCWSGSTRRSGGEPMSFGSSPTQPPAVASSEPSPSKP